MPQSAARCAPMPGRSWWAPHIVQTRCPRCAGSTRRSGTRRFSPTGLCCPPSPERRVSYYAESRLFAALFGIPKERLPPDWIGFCAYMDAMTESSTLTVTELARRMAHRLLAGADSWLPIPGAYRSLTAALLPPQLRDAFALPYGNCEREDAR